MERLAGAVVEGIGKGNVFLSQTEYQKRIQELAGFSPFPGTLNLKIDAKEWKRMKKQLPKKTFSAFTVQQQSFGGADLYSCQLPDQSVAAIIAPHKTAHPENIVEIIASENLREKFKLKNGKSFEIVFGETE